MTKATKREAAEAAEQGDMQHVTQRLTALETQVRTLRTDINKLTATLELLMQRPARGAGIEQQGYISGRWHRRDGTVYGGVAAKGTPNADDPSGPVQPPKRG
jgi:hypothetical protein